jgi:hypothetical protein
MEPLNDLVSRLERAYNDGLVSVVLYGSAAAPGQADRFSDFNVLCVLKEITPRELAQGEPILRWWTEQGNPPPLLMSEEEVYSSADSFPIEFRDMQQRRRVLYGPDPIADVTVHDTHYRAHVEHELRVNLLRLRQRGAASLSDPRELLALCASSVSTFCVLARHVLTLAGILPAAERRAVLRQLADSFGIEVAPFETLLDIREEKAGDPGDPGDLFAQYLVSIGRLIAVVDRHERNI